MDYLLVQLLLPLVAVFVIGLVAGRLLHLLSPASGAVGDRAAVAESLATAREAEARQLRSEVDTMRERLRIAEAEAAAAQSDAARTSTQLSTTRTDFSRKIIALEDEIAALKRPKPAAPVPSPAPAPIAAAPAPVQTAVARPAPKPAPAPSPPPPPPAPAIIDAEIEPLPLVASMEIPAPAPPPAPAPAPAPTPQQPAPSVASFAPAPPTQPAELPPDDLKEIVGIGPILEHTLQSLGLKTFAQIATITPEDIAMLIVKVDSSIAERVLRERWVEQARELYAKKYGKAAA
jgi:predicted flap endonuclease-1-like 5' DNA nuclease